MAYTVFVLKAYIDTFFWCLHVVLIQTVIKCKMLTLDLEKKTYSFLIQAHGFIV